LEAETRTGTDKESSMSFGLKKSFGRWCSNELYKDDPKYQFDFQKEYWQAMSDTDKIEALLKAIHEKLLCTTMYYDNVRIQIDTIILCPDDYHLLESADHLFKMIQNIQGKPGEEIQIFGKHVVVDFSKKPGEVGTGRLQKVKLTTNDIYSNQAMSQQHQQHLEQMTMKPIYSEFLIKSLYQQT
jgi:hypothetical protein